MSITITKTAIAASVAASLLMAAAPFALAQTDTANSKRGPESKREMRVSTTTAADTAAKIACVGAAVTAREAAVSAAVVTHTSAINAAYAARASALAAAYGQTTASMVRAAVKSAWRTFGSSIKTSQKTLQSAQKAAWKTYRAAAVACKAPDGTGDGSNSGLEISGR